MYEFPQTEDSRATRMIAGFAIGALVGAGLALLLAPAPGTETRRRLSETARKLRDNAGPMMDKAGQALDKAGQALHIRGNKEGDRSDQTQTEPAGFSEVGSEVRST